MLFLIVLLMCGICNANTGTGSANTGAVQIIEVKAEYRNDWFAILDDIQANPDLKLRSKWFYEGFVGFSVEVHPTLLSAIKSDKRFQSVTENRRYQRITYTNFTNPSPFYNWGLSRISFPVPQPISEQNKYSIPGSGQGQGTHIYILDTGINFNSSEFTGRIGNGALCYLGTCNNTGDLNDALNHGTPVAGAALGATTGVAQQATLHMVKVTNDVDGSASDEDLINGIGWSIDQVRLNRVFL